MQTASLFSAQSKTLPVSCTTTASTSAALPAAGNTLRLVNEGTVVVFFSIGATAQTATLPNATPTATSTPIGIGATLLVSIPADAIQNISAITRSGTAILHAQVGEGS